MTKEKTVFKNTIILAIGTFLPRVINVATTPIITTYLKKAEMGIVSWITNVVLTFIVPICTLQLEQSFFRFLMEAKTKDDKKRVITSGFSLILLIMIILGIIGLFIPVDGFDGIYKVLLIVYLWVEILAQMSKFILRAFSMYKQYSVFAMIAVVVNFGVLLLTIIVLKMGYQGMFIALLVADIVGLLYVLISSPILSYISIKHYDRDTLKLMVNYALPFVPNMVAFSANLAADQTIIKIILGNASNGIYGAANRIPSIVSILYPAFNLAWIESAVKVAKDGDCSKYYSKMYKTIFCILSGGTAILLACAVYLFPIIIRDLEEYGEALQYVPTLIIATYIYCFAQFFSSIYIALNESKNMSVSTTLAAIVNIIINFSLIHFIGLQAAVISTLISNFLLAAYRYYDINKRHCRMRVSNRLLVLTIFVLGIEMILFWMYHPILNIVSLVLAIGYAYFMCGDIVIPLLQSFLKKGNS